MPNQRFNVGQRVFDNGPTPTSESSPRMPPRSQDGMLRPCTHLQSSRQRQSSRGPAVLGGATSYAGFRAQPANPVPGAGNGVVVPSRPMPGHLNGLGSSSHIGGFQTSGCPFFRGPVPAVLNDGFGGRNGARLAEGYHRREEQGSLEAYPGYQSIHNTSGLNYQTVDPRSVGPWNQAQPFIQEPLPTNSGLFENQFMSFDESESSFGFNIASRSRAHTADQWSPEPSPSIGSIDQSFQGYPLDLDSTSCHCHWRGCDSSEFYNRESLWKHIRDYHYQSCFDGDRLVCRWDRCGTSNGFKEPRSLRRHIDDQHAFPNKYECRKCGLSWGRRDKFQAHSRKSKCASHQ